MEEGGIVCLNFSRYGDNKLRGYSNKHANQLHHTNLGAIQNTSLHGKRERPTTSLQMEGRFNVQLTGNNTSRMSNNIHAVNNFDSHANVGAGRSHSRTFKMAIPSPHRSAALIHKNFMQTFRNIGYESS